MCEEATMRKWISVLVASLAFVALPAGANEKTANKGTSEAQSFSGCIEEGAECLVLRLSDEKTRYVLNLGPKIERPKPNTAVTVVGVVTETPTGICMQGKAIQVEELTVLKLPCPKPKN
jgi:hypothetical protein